MPCNQFSDELNDTYDGYISLESEFLFVFIDGSDFHVFNFKSLKVLTKNPAFRGMLFYTNWFAMRYSAICTAFVAAPFLRLSATIQQFNVLG